MKIIAKEFFQKQWQYLLLSAVVFPFALLAAFDTVSIEMGTILSVNGYDLETSAGSLVESFTINDGGSLVVNLDEGSSLSLSSADRVSFANNDAEAQGATIETTCEIGQSTMTLSYSGESGPVTVTIVPEGSCGEASGPTLDFERVSVDDLGVEGDDASRRPSLSSDGRYVAFWSSATNLVADDTNLEDDVFVYDRETDTVERVSVSSAGVEGNGSSYNPSISGDGRYVVFQSDATNLVAEDPLSTTDVFIHDRQTGTTEIISVTPGSFHISQQTADGQFEEMYESTYDVSYSTKTFLFEPESSSLTLRVVQREIPFGDIEAVQLLACGDDIDPTYARYVDTSEDVREDVIEIDHNVVTNHERPIEISWSIPASCDAPVEVLLTANEYTSSPENHLRFPVWSGRNEVYRFENVGTANVDGHISEVDGVREADFSPYWQYNTGHPDGEVYFYFQNDDEYLYLLADIVGDNTNDYGLDWIELVTYDSAGDVLGTYRVSDLDATYGLCGFGYTSKATFKHQTCEVRVPLEELPEDVIEFSIGYYGTAGAEAGVSVRPVISEDGRYVAFESRKNILPEDLNAQEDIYVYDTTLDTFERVSLNDEGVESGNASYEPSISSDGRYVAFHADATDLVDDDTNGAQDVFVYDRTNDTIERVSVDGVGTEGDGNSYNAAISGDGRYVVFESDASNLTIDADNGVTDVFLYDRNADTIQLLSPDANTLSTYGSYLSGEGEYAVLTVYDGNDSSEEIYRYDITEGTYLYVTEGSAMSGFGLGDLSYEPVLSSDGLVIAFASDADNLINSDTNDVTDVFVYAEAAPEEPPAEEEEEDDGGGGVAGRKRPHHRFVGTDLNLEEIIRQLRTLIQAFIDAGGTATPEMLTFIGKQTDDFTRDLELGMTGDDVRRLQEFLIAENRGPAAEALAAHGVTGYFGPLTQAALAEFQASVGIAPAVGFFGPVTRAYVNAL